MPLNVRAQQASCPVAARLLLLMEAKQSNLCVAADVTDAKRLLDIASAVGPHVAVLKTHSDLVRDWSSDTAQQLCALAKQYNFLILEDRYGL